MKMLITVLFAMLSWSITSSAVEISDFDKRTLESVKRTMQERPQDIFGLIVYNDVVVVRKAKNKGNLFLYKEKLGEEHFDSLVRIAAERSIPYVRTGHGRDLPPRNMRCWKFKSQELRSEFKRSLGEGQLMQPDNGSASANERDFADVPDRYKTIGACEGEDLDDKWMTSVLRQINAEAAHAQRFGGGLDNN